MNTLVSKRPNSQLEDHKMNTLAAYNQVQQEYHYNIDTYGPHSDGLTDRWRTRALNRGQKKQRTHSPLKTTHKCALKYK